VVAMGAGAAAAGAVAVVTRRTQRQAGDVTPP
jgi:hypothetical protein